ncbi:hypothetical protein KUCAC02_003984 [Chaenocephalus aceratus]|uniref:Uncharacterized protein n=1 Tax=Chaenocephalus aceratus TaxID=36190 RepID=A0ACB9WY29_CHAAC|nr:hypothetical protein KUCAC02_003984 [Chaenocephalus aceratus]
MEGSLEEQAGRHCSTDLLQSGRAKRNKAVSEDRPVVFCVSSREEVDVTAAALLKKLDITRRARWTEVVESIDFTHSSRKAWQTINQLTGRNTTPHSCPVTANAIASQLLKNGRFPDADKAFARLTSREVSCISGAASVDSNLSGEFTAEELSEAMSKLKPGKSPGRDNIHPDSQRLGAVPLS